MTTDFRALCAELLDELMYYTDWSDAEGLKERARAALADEPAVPEGREPVAVVEQPKPVPVSERLPGLEDCDADGYCWRWSSIGRLWVRQSLGRRWYDFETYWLPAHALPIPQQQENTDG